MFAESVIRKSIWASVPFNLVSSFAIAFPESFLGQLVEVPQAPAFQSYLLAFIILLFGAMYAWIAWQPTINRPMLAFGALSKCGVFLIGTMLMLADDAPFMLFLALIGDCAFGSLWLAWLRSNDD